MQTVVFCVIVPYVEIEQKRILFVHIPKTGGTSIEKSMERLAPLRLCLRAIPGFLKVPPEHFTMHDIEGLFGESYFDYCFTIVRDPYARLESEYRMRNALSKERVYKGLPPFPYWLEQQFTQTRREETYLANHFRPQVQFLSDTVKVFKYEAGLEAILRRVSAETGVSIALDRERHLDSSKENVRIHWSLEALRMANDFYQQDFELLGYPKRVISPSIC